MSENDVSTDIRTREIRPREYGKDPLATCSYMGDWYSEEELAELKRRVWQKGKEDWEKTQHGKLCLAFYDAFHAYKEYLETHPSAHWIPRAAQSDYEEHELFEEGLRMAETQRREREETLRRNLEKAQKAARCQHRYLNGDRCGAPRVRGQKLCHMHERLEEAKTEMLELDLGPMEDADSILVGIKKLQRAIIEGKLNHRQVGQLAYTIQLAAWNVKGTSMAAKKVPA